MRSSTPRPLQAGQAPRGELKEKSRRSGRDPVGRVAQPGVEEPQIVVELRQGPDRRAGIARDRPLADGDGGGKAGDMGDLGPSELAQELAGVGGERFEVAPLGFPEDDVERQGGLSGAGHAGDDGDPAARDVDVDPPEVVLGRPLDDDAVAGGGFVEGGGRSALVGHGDT